MLSSVSGSHQELAGGEDRVAIPGGRSRSFALSPKLLVVALCHAFTLPQGEHWRQMCGITESRLTLLMAQQASRSGDEVLGKEE